MAKIRSRQPSPKTQLGGTTWKKRLMKGLGAIMLVTALEKGQGAQAQGRKKNGIGAKLAEAFLLGTVLNKERQEPASREGRAHTPVKQQAALQEQPIPEPAPPALPRRPSPRRRWPLVVLLLIALGAIGFFWLNAHLSPADMLHFHLRVGGQGARFFQFTLQQGQHQLLQVGLDAIQILLVMTIAVVETLLAGLVLDRASPIRLVEALFWSLLGIWASAQLVPLLWNGDHKIDGIPLFTVIIGAFLILFLFHLLRGGGRRAAVVALPPPGQPKTLDRSAGTVVAPAPVAAPTATVPGVHLLFHSQRVGLDPALVEQLVSFILATEHSLDGAIYDLRHPQVLQALATVAQSRRLRLAIDAGKGRVGADPKPGGNQEAVQEAGLSSHATFVHEGSHLMHDKFLIRDGRTIWTGSANFTSGGLEAQDNNCVMIDSPELAQQYEATFLDLLSANHDHKHVRGRSVMGQAVRLGEATITPGFAPAAGEGIEQTMMSLLKGARRVRILAFLIGDAGILDALAQVQHADVKGIYDPNGMEDVLRSSRQDRAHFWFLHDERFVAAPSHAFHGNGEQDFMHNKVFIINDEWVITGSYNFSENAEANDENVLQIHSPAIAAAYNTYFDALYTTYRQQPGHLNDHPAHQPDRRGGKRGRWPAMLNMFARR